MSLLWAIAINHPLQLRHARFVSNAPFGSAQIAFGQAQHSQVTQQAYDLCAPTWDCDMVSHTFLTLVNDHASASHNMLVLGGLLSQKKREQPTMTMSDSQPQPTATMELRALLLQLDLDALVHSHHRRSGIAIELLHDQVMEVLAELLAKEEQFRHSFPNVQALAGYVKKIVTWRSLDALKAKGRESPLNPSLQGSSTPSAEELLLRQVHKRSLCEWVNEVFANHKGERELRDEALQLLRLVLNDSERLIRTRQSGSKKGHLSFDVTAIAEELDWTRQRVYDRLERLRKMLVNAAKQQACRGTR